MTQGVVDRVDSTYPSHKLMDAFRLGAACRLRIKMSSAEWALAGSRTTSGTGSALMHRGRFLAFASSHLRIALFGDSEKKSLGTMPEGDAQIQGKLGSVSEAEVEDAGASAEFKAQVLSEKPSWA